MDMEWTLHHFYQATLIPISLYTHGSLSLYHTGLTYDPGFQSFVMGHAAESTQPLGYTLIENQLFMAYLRLKHEDGFLLFGPVALFKVTDAQARALLKKMKRPVIHGDEVAAGLNKTPLYTLAQARHFLSLLDFLLNGEKDRTIEYVSTVPKEVKIASEPPDIPFILGADASVENEIISYVEYGRPDLMQALLESLFSSGESIPDVSPDADRAFKNIFIFATGIISRAALKGGADYSTVNETSTYYLKAVEERIGYLEIGKLIQRMIMHFSNMVAMMDKSATDTATTRRIKQTVIANINEKITPTLIAKQLKMDVSYLCRHFKQHTGMTIASYVNQVKVSECKRLLSATDMSVLQISARLGFSSQNYMASVFKKLTGTTPEAYRHKVR
jgi:AraC-like DNA-binding protein